MAKINRLLGCTALSCLVSFGVCAKEMKTNMAQMQAMDKITGRVSVINVPVKGEVLFGSFSIVVRDCQTRPPEETPENFAFVDVVDNYEKENAVNIFKGWMMSSSPALNAVEHPIYDVWLLKCYNSSEPQNVLSEEELRSRDDIPKAENVNKEIKIEDVIAKLPELEKQKIQEEIAAPTPIANIEEVQKENSSEIVEEALPNTEVVNTEVVMEEEGPKSLLNIENVTDEEVLQEPSVEPVVVTEPLVIEPVEEISAEVGSEVLEDVVMPAQEPMAHQEEQVLAAPSPADENQLIDFSAEEVVEESFEIETEALQ